MISFGPKQGGSLYECVQIPAGYGGYFREFVILDLCEIASYQNEAHSSLTAMRPRQELV
jgi:hypothetical protein